MGCYQEVLQNETLQQCSHVYLELQPLRESVNAYQFYCLPDSKNSTNLQQLVFLSSSVFTCIFL